MVQSFLVEERRQGDACLHEKTYLFLIYITSPFCCVCVEHCCIQVAHLFHFFRMFHWKEFLLQRLIFTTLNSLLIAYYYVFRLMIVTEPGNCYFFLLSASVYQAHSSEKNQKLLKLQVHWFAWSIIPLEEMSFFLPSTTVDEPSIKPRQL